MLEEREEWIITQRLIFETLPLRALELNVKGNPEPELVPNEDTVINLEHILPENPGPGWGGIAPDTARSYFQRLGNMVLLQASRNAAIGNKKFADKVAVMKTLPTC